MQSKGLCTSYTATLIEQVECGSNLDEEVKKWTEEVHQNNQKEKELAKKGRETVEVYNKSRSDQGYTLVMDNVGMVVHTRQPDLATSRHPSTSCRPATSRHPAKIE